MRNKLNHHLLHHHNFFSLTQLHSIIPRSSVSRTHAQEVHGRWGMWGYCEYVTVPLCLSFLLTFFPAPVWLLSMDCNSSPGAPAPDRRTCSSMCSLGPQFLSGEYAMAWVQLLLGPLDTVWVLQGQSSCQENQVHHQLSMGMVAVRKSLL